MSVSTGAPGLARKSVADSLGTLARIKPGIADEVEGNISSAFSSVLTSITVSTGTFEPTASAAQSTVTMLNADIDYGYVNPGITSGSYLPFPDSQWLASEGVLHAPAITPDTIAGAASGMGVMGSGHTKNVNDGGITSVNAATLACDQQGIITKNLTKSGPHLIENDPEQALAFNVMSGINGDGKSTTRFMTPIQQNDASGFVRHLIELSANTGNSDRMSTQLEPLQERASTKSLGNPVEGLLSGANYSIGIGAQSSAMLPDGQAGDAKTMVAEQVKYWVSQQVQNAELKLDGFGKDPVEVSISLSGNEARVEFRSDQVATRDVLESAVLQLKELLENEGLQLASVSVGSSAHDRAGTNESHHSSDGRKAIVASPEPPMREELTGQGLSASVRVIDLFV